MKTTLNYFKKVSEHLLESDSGNLIKFHVKGEYVIKFTFDKDLNLIKKTRHTIHNNISTKGKRYILPSTKQFVRHHYTRGAIYGYQIEKVKSIKHFKKFNEVFNQELHKLDSESK